MIESVLDDNPELKVFIFGPNSEDFKFDPIFIKQMEDSMLMHSKMISLHEKMSEINNQSWWSLFDELWSHGLCSNNHERQPLSDPIRM